MNKSLKLYDSSDFFSGFERFLNNVSKFMDYDDSFSTRRARVDLEEKDNEYILNVELLGFDPKEDIEVTLRDNRLEILAQRNGKEEKEGRHTEFSSRLSRNYHLPGQVVEDKVRAKYDKGILTLTLPKAEPKKVESGKKIEIEES